ncbi:F-box/FBD/LRR-repeat protein, partial [Mucuna pruriens]
MMIQSDAECGEHIDRISSLPCNIIETILEYMPVEDIIKTSILSRKWRYRWTSVQRLEFTNNFFEKSKHFEICSIITEVLFLHNGSIHDFILHIPPNYSIKMQCLGKWLLFLSRKDIKEIQLASLQIDPPQVPSHIFSCQDLTYLHVQGFRLPIAPNFSGFKNLTFLYLFDVIFESDTCEKMVSGCPLLRALTVSNCSGFEHINVSSPVLQYLLIECDQVMKSICLKKAKDLVNLTLWGYRLEDNFEGDWVSDFMKSLQKIEKLHLGGGYIQSKSDAVGPQMVLRGFEFNKCCFSRLQIVNITVGTAYKCALSLIRFVLAKSSSLEILNFKVGFGLNQLSTRSISRISRNLLRMKRASSRAEVKLVRH